MNKKYKLLVIHGFNSSPLSFKALAIKKYVQIHFPDIEVISPQLKTNPKEAIAQLCQIIDNDLDCQWFLTGSSLGGFYATYLVAKYHCKAVLINPAVKPYELLQDVLGQQTNPYTGETFEVTSEHMQYLQQIERPVFEPKNFFVMVQTGDEVLDYRQAVEKYQQCEFIVQQGGDHSFIGFDAMLSTIMTFFLAHECSL
ncbi:YqiA/YcfP family alpha/beta fold hydrolase [Thalassotalea aquiviva]|uniref:YqiA/YcfP family alpha/beta fold hydrolase n=1 Tax=Thalassotalea aquiviva TaxID=3242415 RepID=UPI00352A24EF